MERQIGRLSMTEGLGRSSRRDRILKAFRLSVFHGGFTVFLFFPLLLTFVSCVTEEHHFSFCSTKVLNVTIKEVTYPYSVYYTTAFVLKGLCHAEGSFMFYSLSQKLDSSMTLFIPSGITQCLHSC